MGWASLVATPSRIQSWCNERYTALHQQRHPELSDQKRAIVTRCAFMRFAINEYLTGALDLLEPFQNLLYRQYAKRSDAIKFSSVASTSYSPPVDAVTHASYSSLNHRKCISNMLLLHGTDIPRASELEMDQINGIGLQTIQLPAAKFAIHEDDKSKEAVGKVVLEFIQKT